MPFFSQRLIESFDSEQVNIQHIPELFIPVVTCAQFVSIDWYVHIFLELLMIAMGTLFQIILTIAIVAHHSQHINQHQKVRSCCSALFSSHQTKRKCINFYVNVHRMWQSFHFRTINSTKNPTARNAHFDENVYLHVFVWNASLCPVFFHSISQMNVLFKSRPGKQVDKVSLTVVIALFFPKSNAR